MSENAQEVFSILKSVLLETGAAIMCVYLTAIIERNFFRRKKNPQTELMIDCFILAAAALTLVIFLAVEFEEWRRGL